MELAEFEEIEKDVSLISDDETSASTVRGQMDGTLQVMRRVSLNTYMTMHNLWDDFIDDEYTNTEGSRTGGSITSHSGDSEIIESEASDDDVDSIMEQMVGDTSADYDDVDEASVVDSDASGQADVSQEFDSSSATHSSNCDSDTSDGIATSIPVNHVAAPPPAPPPASFNDADIASGSTTESTSNISDSESDSDGISNGQPHQHDEAVQHEAPDIDSDSDSAGDESVVEGSISETSTTNDGSSAVNYPQTVSQQSVDDMSEQNSDISEPQQPLQSAKASKRRPTRRPPPLPSQATVPNTITTRLTLEEACAAANGQRRASNAARAALQHGACRSLSRQSVTTTATSFAHVLLGHLVRGVKVKHDNSSSYGVVC